MQSWLTSYWRLHYLPILLVLASLAFYYTFGYLLEREDTLRLFTLYAALFFLCFKLIQFEKWNLRFLLVAGILFRLVFWFAVPNLSQDFYRFLWDGRLLLEGINPYLYRPDELIQMNHPAVADLQGLYQGMGELSARHYSNYPPVNQLFFALAALLGGQSVFGSLIAMRTLFLFADLGILYFGRKLLMRINRSPHLIYWYFLNPLVLIELSGNLHFEGVMLFFFLWALYLIATSRPYWAAMVYSLAILLKLVPLLFLPLFLTHFGLKKSLAFYGCLVLSCVLFSLPFLAPEVLPHYTETLGLWFSNFEFNAGFYNLLKETGNWFDVRPWELIKSYGKLIPLLTLAVVLAFTFFRDNRKLQLLLGSMMWVLAGYYLLSPTVHPWYIIPMLLLCLYTDFRFPIFWSAVVILSYSAYANPGYTENLWLLALEYIVVIGMMIYEILRFKGEFFSFRKN